MSDPQIEEIKAKVDIVDLISESVELKKAGRNYKGLCPFHSEKTPSFMVTPELQIFKCFGCSIGGDVFRFIMEYEKLEFGEALKLLADKAGVKLKPTKGTFISSQKEELYAVNNTIASFYHYLLTTHVLGKKALEYLKNRGVEEPSIKSFKLGFSPENPASTFTFLTKKRSIDPQILIKTGVIGQTGSSYYDRFRGRVMFPLFDHLGNTVGFAGRILDSNAKLAKYINTPETPIYKKGNLLYGLNLTKQEIKKAGYAVVVEGELDAISSYQAGVKNVVAIKGSAITEEQLRLLSRFCSRIVLALDSDFAGDEASRRGIKIAAALGINLRVANIAPYKDPDEIAKADPVAWKKAVKEAKDVYEFLIDSVFNRFDPQTTEGKGRISREISPILAEVEDEILKAHLIKLVADRLGVGEQAVISQASKFVNQRHFTPSLRDRGQVKLNEEEDAPDVPIITRRELLERHLLTCILQSDSALFQSERVASLITTRVAKKLFDNTKEWSLKNKKFDPASLSEELPPELKEYLALLILAATEDDDPTFLKRETDGALKNLEVLDLKEKINLITERIKEADRKNNEESLSRYERDLGRFTQKLAELESA